MQKLTKIYLLQNGSNPQAFVTIFYIYNDVSWEVAIGGAKPIRNWKKWKTKRENE